MGITIQSLKSKNSQGTWRLHIQRKSITAFFCLIIWVIFSHVWAQPGEISWAGPSEANYSKILEQFEADRWENVISMGEQFCQRYKRSARESSIIFLMAQAALRLRDLDRAVLEAERLKIKFPDSKYVDDAHWILAEAALMAEHWEEAESQMQWIIGFSQDEDLTKSTRARLDELHEFLDDLQKHHDSNLEISRVRHCIALILPLSGPFSENAEDFRRGFEISYRLESGGDVVVFDSETDPVRAARLARQSVRDDSVIALVGGLDPAESAVLAAVAEADRIPFVTTACGVEGVAAVGRYVFQGRANYGIIGQKLARYAISDLDLHRFAILVPMNQEGLQLAGGFKREVDEAGDEILAEEVYYPGTKDLRSYFARIRDIGLRRVFDDSLRLFFDLNGCLLIDSVKYFPPADLLAPNLPPPGLEFSPDEDTTLTLSDNLLDSLWITGHEKMRKWMMETEQEIDSLEIPIDVFDGFLLVVEQDMVEMVAPQFARANLNTQLLGGETWADRAALSKVGNYLNGLIFAEPISAAGGADYYEFAAEITGDSSQIVSKYHLAGDRAAKMIAFAAKRAETPEDMRLSLSLIRDLETVSGKVSLLKEERVDRRVRLVQYLNGEFVDKSE